MTRGTLKVLVDTDAHKPTALIDRVARMGVPVALTHRMLRDLEHELHGYRRAVRWLIRLAEETGRPVAVNLPRGEGSQTILLAPKSWTAERLQGWAGGMHEELAELFGPATLGAFPEQEGGNR